MNYLSTRGGVAGVKAAEAIRLGIAPDGGLFTPEAIPRLTPAELQEMQSLGFEELATRILSLYLNDYRPERLAELAALAYATPAKFDHPRVTPVAELQPGQFLLELWHGPTCAFKDIALQLLPYLMTEAGRMARDRRELVILVATSGDTGKAALEGFRDVAGTRVIVFFPDQGVSPLQRLQMVTQEGKNTAVVGIRGNFDDAQNGVKAIFADPALAKALEQQGMAFSSANSINWGRLVPQIVYYFFGYFELCRQGGLALGDPLNLAVPTGNFGNILAAYFAKKMGLPVAKLICASNSNNVLTDLINTGLYNRQRQFYTTISPSMDILISSNLERLLYYLAGGGATTVKQWMGQLQTEGQFQVDPDTETQIKLHFYGGYASEAATRATIKQVFESSGKVLDPHTAVGQTVYQRYLTESSDTTPVLLAATASPFKFNTSVLQAILGEAAVAGQSEFVLLAKLAELSGMKIPQGLQGLDQKPVLHQSLCDQAEMAAVVERLLGS